LKPRLRLCQHEPDFRQVRLRRTFRQIRQLRRDPLQQRASSVFVQRASSPWVNTLIIVSSFVSGPDRRGLDEA
jgi:hypothetical protein